MTHENLFERLKEYGQSDCYPFHMPGHKRNPIFWPDIPLYSGDITEIDGFDNLNDACGIIKDAQERAGRLYGGAKTWFLVNGSTVGLLCAIAACCKPGDSLLMGRNCHKAVYNGVYLNDLNPVYIYPEVHERFGVYQAVDPEDVEAALDGDSNIRGVVITSPTYDGIVSDIQAIADTAHKHGVLLIVDEAHGAHLGFHPYFPEGALSGNADIVIHSVHKTLPAPTQTALLHVQGELVDRDKLGRLLTYYQSSSPSYIFMAGIDHCMYLLENEGNALFLEYSSRLEQLRALLGGLGSIKLAEKKDFNGHCKDYDRSKLFFYTGESNLNGQALYERLRLDYHLQMEMAGEMYTLAMTSFCDTQEGFDRLAEALKAIDSQAGSKSISPGGLETSVFAKQQVPAVNIRKALEGKSKTVPLKESAGRVSREYVYLYPPGIPLVAPGEAIDGQTIRQILKYRELGLTVSGMKDKTLASIEVLE